VTSWVCGVETDRSSTSSPALATLNWTGMTPRLDGQTLELSGLIGGRICDWYWPPVFCRSVDSTVRLSVAFSSLDSTVLTVRERTSVVMALVTLVVTWELMAQPSPRNVTSRADTPEERFVLAVRPTRSAAPRGPWP
jgi:hypothetical protein